MFFVAGWPILSTTLLTGWYCEAMVRDLPICVMSKVRNDRATVVPS